MAAPTENSGEVDKVDSLLGGRAPGDPVASQAAGKPVPNHLAGELPEIISGSNPLVAAANPILNLIPQLRVATYGESVEQLRNYLVEQMQLFDRRARQAMVPNETVVGARYCLCTAIDETAAQTPWGGGGVWSRNSLLATFHNEVTGGEKFFQLLSKLAQNPQQHKDLLELMYYCLLMGFEGRFRIIDNGRTQLETLKQRLLQIFETARGEVSRSLSSHWKGEEPGREKAWMYLPVWVVACVAGLIGMLLYFWFTFSLAQGSDDLFASINGLRMPHVQVIAEPAPPRAAPPRLAKFLETEIREGLVSVRDDADRSVVVLRGDGLFAPASSTVLERYVPIIARIADALNGTPGAVLVTGYTDNVSIRTLQYPSNWHLSQARADTVKQMLDARLTTPARVRATGRGAEDPVAPNDSPANRAKNRRVEITLMVAADRAQ